MTSNNVANNQSPHPNPLPEGEGAITPEMVAEHGLTVEEYQRILGIMGREPNINELGIFSVMWSEHCSYKTTRLHLAKLPTEAPWVICGPGENAGVIDIGDGQAAIFKMESHNHPSYIEPFQGAATGVGGILRDVFTMGARPVANMNALRFGDPSHPKTKHLVSGVVAGIGGYGNCVGVPTVGGECNFDPSYNGNILVNAMTVGVADTDKIFYSTAAGIGNPVVYVGSKTGRDGIHGATMASAEFDEDSESKRPTVQVGDPFTEKLLIEACLELMQTDVIVAIQDMGAAGLTSSSLEMAGKGGLGMKLILDDVPMREEGMTPYELMLSESQERMLMVLKPGKEHIAKDIFDKWELDCATIGELTDTGNLELWMHGECVADMPIAPISVDAPKYDRPHTKTIPEAEYKADATALNARNVMADLHTMLGSPNLASRRWIWEQYDHQVGNDTVQKPGGNAALVRVHGTNKALAISTDCTPRYCKANPIEGGKQAVTETYRNIISTGAKPLAITNCLNFGNPEKPEIMGQLVGCLDGISQACIALEYPVVSGNVSLYNDTDGISILPTPAIGGVGLLENLAKRIPQTCSEGDVVYMLGETKGHLGQSIYQEICLGGRAGDAPHVDLKIERTHGNLIQSLAANGTLNACTDVSDGGLLVAVAEICMAQNIGITLTPESQILSPAQWFGEDQGRYVLVASKANQEALEQAATSAAVSLTKLGTLGGDALAIDGAGEITIADLKTAHEGWLPGFMR